MTLISECCSVGPSAYTHVDEEELLGMCGCCLEWTTFIDEDDL